MIDQTIIISLFAISDELREKERDDYNTPSFIACTHSASRGM